MPGISEFGGLDTSVSDQRGKSRFNQPAAE